MSEKKPIHHLAAGIIIALVIVLVSVVLALLNGANAGAGVGWIGMVIFVAALIFFIERYGKAIDYQATFGGYFNYGFKATTMVVLLYIVYLLVMAFLMPDIKEGVIEATKLELEKQRSLGEADREKAIEMTRKYFWQALIGISVFMLASVGAIGSLIGAAVTKKLPKNPSEQIFP